MIPRYSDLAANERTYLAWMRTALALIAFGFLLERFNLLMRGFAKSIGSGMIANTPARDLQTQQEVNSMDAYGIILSILGIVMMILSTVRFVRTNRLIRSEEGADYGITSVLLTGSIFILLALFVLLYFFKMV